MDNFKNDIKNLLDLTDKMDKLKKSLNEIKSQKDDLENDVLNYMNENNIKHKDIYLNNNKITYSSIKSYECISKKYVLQKLKDILKDEQLADKATNYIFDTRTTTQKDYLKIAASKKK